MKIVNFGSLNVDHVYRVPRFVGPGETIPSLSLERHPGGKGLNQSIALARAGAKVCHAGKIGPDGLQLRETLDQAGVDTRLVVTGEGPTGHAIIQVSPEGENSIIIAGGANRDHRSSDLTRIFESLDDGDWLLLQNETNGLPELFERLETRDVRLVYNPAPMTEEVHSLPLERVELLIVNESEASALGESADPEAAVSRLLGSYPGLKVILTRGAAGAVYRHGTDRLEQPAFTVKALDTTAAGDTFIGFLLSALSQGRSLREALALGCAASALCVTRHGAAVAIPSLDEVVALLEASP